ncbi:MAG TPA: type II toxin-antitoxin system antitoxin SocA domain-containing protein, partial [Methylocella sp.]|nr:type II toxin-antitoxin system antitoxin SocA domain-containing protein [Methylocella sp.]
LHANYLARFERPLVTAKVEAWQYGPVFREVYHAFKKFSDGAITARATRIDPLTGLNEVCNVSLPFDEIKFLEEILPSYIQLSTSALVDLSHKTGGPWHSVWNYDGRANPSMKISDDVIKSWYKTSVRH